MSEADVMDCIDLDSIADTNAIVATSERFNVEVLEVGLVFQSIEEVQQRYAQYAKGRGFQVRRRNSWANVVQFVCYREGFPEVRKTKKDQEGDKLDVHEICFTKTGRVGCRACLYCSLDPTNNTWRITKFQDDHNHGMVSPKSRKYLRTGKVMDSSAKCLSQVFAREGIGIGKVTNVLAPNPEDATFTKKDCWNYMTSVRRKILDSGDANAVHMFCIRQSEINSNFRYAIQLDDEDRMINFFWVDARSRSAYLTFEDVVSFDTTYRTNKYNMPFAPFVGIDNHMHTILYGCALLQDETEETFIWLFKAWLHAMDDKFPTSFVTDQDMSIINAVDKVFPNTKHRLCLWHIKKKFPERLSHIYHDHSKFKADLNNCIHDSISISEFESTWSRLLVEYGLINNEWFKSLYDMRHRWVSVFCKHVFFGGMNTTGRSESINSFFDDFVHSGTSLKEFVHRYSQALENLYETFRRSEFDSRHKVPILNIGIGMEEHVSRIYTAEVFKLFVKEIRDSLLQVREKLLEEGCMVKYKVSNRLNKERGAIVEYNVDTHESICECRTFEFKGILCKHIISVLFMHSVDEIPAQYIIRRWTKEVGRVLWKSPIAHDESVQFPLRYFEVKSIFDDMWKICENSESSFELMRKGLESLHSNLQDCSHVGSCNAEMQTGSSNQQFTQGMQDPNVTQTKGRKRTTSGRTSRIRTEIEMANDPKVRCSVCFGNGHNRRTCPKLRQPT